MPRGHGQWTHLAEQLRGDREIVIEICVQHGGTLEHAAEELRCDRELVREAV